MRINGIGLAITMILAMLTAEVICRKWGELPWRRYAAVGELQYAYKANGATIYAFDSDSYNGTHYGALLELKEEWLSPTGLVVRVSGIGISENARRCLQGAAIEIRRRRSCIAVRTESSSSEVASNCVESLVRAIVADYVDRDASRMNQALIQVEKSYAKHQKLLAWLEKKLAQQRDSEGQEENDETLIREIESTRKTIVGVHMTMESLGNRNLWGSALERTGVRVSIVPPNRARVYAIVLGGGLAFFLLATCLVRLHHGKSFHHERHFAIGLLRVGYKPKWLDEE